MKLHTYVHGIVLVCIVPVHVTQEIYKYMYEFLFFCINLLYQSSLSRSPRGKGGLTS